MSSLKKISLKDIAEAAGVSTALVSFVLNGKRKSIRVGRRNCPTHIEIANEMNYQLILTAKSPSVVQNKNNEELSWFS